MWDARAYAATLHPLADDSHMCVIPKQPFGIAFLSTGAFNAARADHCLVDRGVAGVHSPGGTVAMIDARPLRHEIQSFCATSSDAVVGLLLYASHPATDMSTPSAQALPMASFNGKLAMAGKNQQIENHAAGGHLPQGH